MILGLGIATGFSATIFLEVVIGIVIFSIAFRDKRR